MVYCWWALLLWILGFYSVNYLFSWSISVSNLWLELEVDTTIYIFKPFSSVWHIQLKITLNLILNLKFLDHKAYIWAKNQFRTRLRSQVLRVYFFSLHLVSKSRQILLLFPVVSLGSPLHAVSPIRFLIFSSSGLFLLSPMY